MNSLVKNTSRWLQTHWRLIIWLLLLGVIVYFSQVLFGARRERLTADSGLSKPAADAWFFYAPSRLADALPLFSEEGRRYYAITEFTLDLAFPFIYGLWLYLGLEGLSHALNWQSGRWRILNFAPLWMVVADLCENSLMVVNLLAYPPAHAPLISLTAAVSALKWILGLFCVSLLAGGALVYIGSALTRRRT